MKITLLKISSHDLIKYIPEESQSWMGHFLCSIGAKPSISLLTGSNTTGANPLAAGLLSVLTWDDEFIRFRGDDGVDFSPISSVSDSVSSYFCTFCSVIHSRIVLLLTYAWNI